MYLISYMHAEFKSLQSIMGNIYFFGYIQCFVGLLIPYQIKFCQSAPHDVEDKLCPGTTQYVRDNTRVFSSLGQRCSTENDAYVIGALYSHFSSNGMSFDQTSLNDRWTNIAYLDASSYDSLKNPTPPPTTAPSCIFNERLGIQYSSAGLGIEVATACSPFELTFCRTEYDGSLSLKDHCDCNYLYSTRAQTPTGLTACVAKAGVPCKFQNPKITDPFLVLPDSIECHESLICKEHSQVERHKIFKKAFHGFGINPIAHEYIVENAVGYCDCKSATQTINALNECVENVAALIHTSNFSVLLLFFIMRF